MNKTALYNILIGAIGSIVATIIVLFVAKSKGYVTISLRYAIHRYSWVKRMLKAGITNFYADRNDLNVHRKPPALSDYIGTARSSVRIVGYWMAQGITMEGIAYKLGQLAEKNVDIEVSLANPFSNLPNVLGRSLDMKEIAVKEDIKASLSILLNAKSALSENARKRFRIKVYDYISCASVIMIDGDTDTGRLQLEFKPYGMPRIKGFGFELSGRGNELYERCLVAWSKLLESSQSIDETFLTKQP